MSDVPSLSDNAAEVRRLDRDRFLTALFAPANRRDALFALYAFNLELARVREVVSEPLLGQIRLQWWRDTLDSLYGGSSPAHPVARGLAEAIARHDLSRGWFDQLLEARLHDLDSEPPADLVALEAYAEGTAASVNRLALEILGVVEPAAQQAARHLGVAWALTGLLRAVPFHAATGRVYLPARLLAEHGVTAEALTGGRAGTEPTRQGLAKVGHAVAARARHHLAEARRQRRAVPKAALPALLTGPLTESYLRALDRAGGDLLDGSWSAVRPRPLRLAWHAWRGRY